MAFFIAEKNYTMIYYDFKKLVFEWMILKNLES
jgi:hypothetical protein